MKPSAVSAEELARTLPLLCSATVLALLPLAKHLPLDILGFVLAACAWRIAAQYRRARLPGKVPLALLTIAGGALVYSHFHRFHGPEAAASLLLTGVGLKLLELSSRRDLYLIIYLVFLITATAFLFEQGLALAGYTLAIVLLLVACLLSLSGAGDRPLAARLRIGAGLIAQALPVAIVLFLFVPRVPGPLWHLPQDDPAAGSGLSDAMEPGTISKLSLSRGTAFRVDFQSDPPPPRERYWRGPVFWYFDGHRWTAGSPALPQGTGGTALYGPSYAYAITMEPHRQRWVFPLEFAETVPHDLERHADDYLLAHEPIRTRRHYRLTSRLQRMPGLLSEGDRRRALQLPADPSPETLALIRHWRATATDPESLVERALRHFHEEPFVYTLQPPAIGGDPIAGFLFETRRGFCEHYAGAFVYLMRAAGVPARVVTGYQGGHWNPVGRFLEVQQADAHAWAEVWLQDRGWTRIDPTTAVAPERIEREVVFSDRLGIDGAVVFEGPIGETLTELLKDLRGWIGTGRLLWDSADHAWHRWVLAYDPETQMRLMKTLGVADWRDLARWLGICVTAFLLALSVLVLRRGPAPDPALRLYHRVARRLERVGIARDPAEGWHDFAQRVAALRPDLAEPFGHFTELFTTIRYGRDADPAALERLSRLARRFPRP